MDSDAGNFWCGCFHQGVASFVGGTSLAPTMKYEMQNMLHTVGYTWYIRTRVDDIGMIKYTPCTAVVYAVIENNIYILVHTKVPGIILSI